MSRTLGNLSLQLDAMASYWDLLSLEGWSCCCLVNRFVVCGMFSIRVHEYVLQFPWRTPPCESKAHRMGFRLAHIWEKCQLPPPMFAYFVPQIVFAIWNGEHNLWQVAGCGVFLEITWKGCATILWATSERPSSMGMGECIHALLRQTYLKLRSDSPKSDKELYN